MSLPFLPTLEESLGFSLEVLGLALEFDRFCEELLGLEVELECNDLVSFLEGALDSLLASSFIIQ